MGTQRYPILWRNATHSELHCLSTRNYWDCIFQHHLVCMPVLLQRPTAASQDWRNLPICFIRLQPHNGCSVLDFLRHGLWYGCCRSGIYRRCMQRVFWSHWRLRYGSSFTKHGNPDHHCRCVVYCSDWMPWLGPFELMRSSKIEYV